jgi:hypothetical protein
VTNFTALSLPTSPNSPYYSLHHQVTSLEPNNNVFCSNVSNLGYRIVEYNLGVNLLYLYTCAEPFTTLIFQVFYSCQTLIIVVFACVWWSEIGILATETDEPCVRLYYVNGCMRDHAAVLLRGCVLGMTVIASSIKTNAQHEKLCEMDNLLMTCLSAVLLCTPIYVIITGLLELSFTLHAVHDNVAVISICMPSLTLCIISVYNLKCKSIIVDFMIPIYNNTCRRCSDLYVSVQSNYSTMTFIDRQVAKNAAVSDQADMLPSN